MNKIGIGYEDYKRIIDDNCYFVDKTLMIKDILEKGGMVTLFTRPRRFGKTLALSMIRTFFEAEVDRKGDPVDNRRYFEGKKIMDCGNEVLSKMGQYPVIKLSLKSAKQPDFYTAFLKLREEIVYEFSRHQYLADSVNLAEENKKRFCDLKAAEADWTEKLGQCKTKEEKDLLFNEEKERFATSLRLLSDCMKQHHGKNVIILLDEYDVPLENAWFSGFYQEMVDFIRSLFESALKTNDNLEFAVITGCLRISKESIFTGLNHLEICSIRNENFGEYFGFTHDETMQMLADYGIEGKEEEIRRWYDGYLFGTAEVYNPWSVIKYVKAHVANINAFPEPYWANTSSNAIIKDMIWQADDEMKKQLELLISGETIEKRIHEDITYGDINESEDNLWNFLFFTGYMKKVSERSDGENIYLTMKIPNVEIRSIYNNQILGWFEKQVKSTDRTMLHKAILEGDTESIGDYVSDLLAKSISTFDSEESFYHGFFLSLLYGTPGYSPQSNREEGIGKPDIVLYPLRRKNPALVFEIKVRKKYNEMEDGLQEAYDQIKTKKYEEGILDDGYLGVKSYGVCFCKKECVVGKYPG